ncbi:MAG: FMN-binding protein [Rhodospirillaceae bacterium]|nr:FMN-binding protein [Rhodospirillaceae bacterium]|tara:strand:+ start:1525 stop:2115 length:591 start_codon:yes stop_codon:yes gene_type:complete
MVKKCGESEIPHTLLFKLYQSRKSFITFLAGCTIIFFFSTRAHAADDIYQSPTDFLEEAFSGKVPDPEVIWFDASIRKDIKKILGHKFPGIRVRFWPKENKTAWILEEIGKYKPITVGFLINEGSIEQVKVLVYRESHGWEVRYPFFTNQFKDLRLNSDQTLSHGVDGISGATLSVNALTRLARLALYLHNLSLDL